MPVGVAGVLFLALLVPVPASIDGPVRFAPLAWQGSRSL